MKVEITKTVTEEFDAKFLVVDCCPRYWEDATVNDVEDEDGTLIPCREGSQWKPIINVETGIITNWERGVTASVHFKICDEGSYYLTDAGLNNILSIENEYVPSMLAPNGEGYGDYIILDIDSEGKIDGFEFKLSDFSNEEED